MKKKVLAAFLISTLTLMLVAGCGGNSGSDGKDSTNSQGMVTDASGETDVSDSGRQESDGEITEIIWQYPTTIDTNGEGFHAMEDRLNEMMERDIGVHVTFEPVGLSDAQNSAALMISAGEQLDVMLSAFTSIGNVVDKGLILPLDELLEEHGRDILSKSYTKEMCGYDGQTYGITTGDIIGNSYGYMMKKQYWDKYGFEGKFGYSDDKVFTMEEIEQMFAIVKEGEGENFYCTIPSNTSQEPSRSYIPYDKPSGAISGGVLMLNRDFSDTTVYDMFETPEFKEYCEMMYDWAQKGYISPDAAVVSESEDIIYVQDNYLGKFHWHMSDDMNEYESIAGEELISLKTVPFYMSYDGGSVIQWSIPITSANPEKAVEAVNYIYKNNEAAWLIMFGMEGEEYEITGKDGEQLQIKYLADDATSLPYYMPYGIWGDRLAWPILEPSDITLNAKKRALMEECPDSRKSPIFGYSFKSEPVLTEIAAVDTVISQYMPSLNSGALDPSKALPEFIDALKAAGMDKIIEEQQRQIDAWKAGN